MRPSCLETFEASSGSISPQKIIDVVFPVSISDEKRESPSAPALEEALSISLLEGKGEAGVPGAEKEREKNRGKSIK